MAATSKDGSRRAICPISIRGGSDKMYEPGRLCRSGTIEGGLNPPTDTQWRASSGASSRGNSCSISVY